MARVAGSDRRSYVLALALVLAFAFVIRVAAWYAMPNIVWPDEIYQSMEQAHRVVFGYGITPWEFRDGTRSWMLPGVLAGVMKLASTVSSSAFAYLVACASFLSAISLAPVWAAFKLGHREAGVRGAIVAGCAVAVWFELVYFAPKALSEVVAGNLLAVGAVLGVMCSWSDTPPTRRRTIAIAFTLALAAMLRIQLSIAAFAVFVLVVRKLPKRLLWTAIATGAAVVVFAGLLDWVTWSYPFQSYVENVRVNIVEDKSSSYGVATWWAYFGIYANIWGLWAAPILMLALAGARRAPLLALCVGLVLLTHIPIAHKEYRFAYPAVLLVIMLAGLGTAAVVKWIEEQRGARTATLAVAGLVTLWFAGSLVGAGGFHAEKTQVAIVWKTEQDHWSRRRGGLVAMSHIAKHAEVCGLGLAGIGWGDTGGYTYLHRNIPIFPFLNQEMLWKHVRHFNVMFMTTDKPATLGPFVRDTCWDDLCMYVREGPCIPLEGFDINEVIKVGDQRWTNR